MLIISEEILKEYREVMHYEEIREKVKHYAERMHAVEKLIQLALFIRSTPRISIVKDDPDDNKFIEAAVAGNARHIVSRDNHLLKLKKYRNIQILNPEEFLSVIEG